MRDDPNSVKIAPDGREGPSTESARTPMKIETNNANKHTGSRRNEPNHETIGRARSILSSAVNHSTQGDDADARCEIRAVMTLIDEEIVPSADVSDGSEPTRRGSNLLRTDGERR